MLRWAVLAAALAAGVCAPVAYADGGGRAVGNDQGCRGSILSVTVCARDDDSSPSHGSGHAEGASGPADKKGSSKPKCTYTKLDPQPPADNLAMQEGKRQGGKGAVYQVLCPDTGRIGLVWIPDGSPAPPTIDPEVVAHRAVDSMKLVGPKVASPHAGGKYVVGMPMWMWVEQTPTTYGPSSATATAGGVAVTATAKVSSISWSMGDGTEPEVCNGPGTKYRPSMGKASSPDCGHLYKQVSTRAEDGVFHGTATATWQVDWQVNGAPGNAGSFTEVRRSTFTVDVREVQVLN